MNVLNKILKNIFDINFYKLVFMVSCFFYCIPFTNVFFANIFKLFIIWGIFVFCYNFFYNQKYTLKRADYLLFLFLIVALISCFVNYNNNFRSNLIAVLYLFVQTILMISYNQDDLNNKIKHLKIQYYIITVLSFICAVLSIIIFLFNLKFSYNTDFQQSLFGVYEGRLWGFYGNPNSLAQFALVSIFFSITLIIINKYNGNNNKLVNVFLYLNIIVEYVCLILGNSRSTILGFIASLLIASLFLLGLKSKKTNVSIWSSICDKKFSLCLKLILLSLFISLSFIGAKYFMLVSSKMVKNINVNSTINYNADNSKVQVSDETVKVNRDYGDSDLSNGRFELWSAGLKVFSDHPLFGVGNKNINFYANKYLSNETISETPRLSENMHNIYIHVLVSHGIFAFIIFAIYLTYFVYKSFKYLLIYSSDVDNNKLIFKVTTVNFSIIIGLLVINLFDSNIMYFCLLFFNFAFWNSISIVNSFYDSIENKNKKILFLIDSLDNGGAEKALVDLTNNYKNENSIIYIKTIYNEGNYIKKINNCIHYSSIIKKTNILKKRIMYRIIKYLPPKLLYQLFINENYDIEIAFHELLSTKVISGSSNNTYKIAWIHTNIFLNKYKYQMFNNKFNLIKGYDCFDKIVCVSNNIKKSFDENTNLYHKSLTIYNFINSDLIKELSNEKCDLLKEKNKFLIVTIGRLETVKGYNKLCNVIKRLKNKYENIELWIIGEGSQRENLEKYILDNRLEDNIKLLGFKENPYNYLKQADLFISTSEVEGFSLAVAEAVILGLPVISTNTDGPREILDNGNYGLLINHDEQSIYYALEKVIKYKEELKKLKNKSLKRKNQFKSNKTILMINKLFEGVEK